MAPLQKLWRMRTGSQASGGRSGGGPALALLFYAFLVVGCASARNYLDPAGPIFTGGAHTSHPAAAAALRIVTFNLKFGEDIDRAVAMLLEPGPLANVDVLLLQEMDVAGTERLADALHFNYVYVPSAVHPASRRDTGVAVLSPWPLQDAAKVPLPHQHRLRRLRRSAARATVVTGLGLVRVYSVHLETPFGASGEERRDQAKALADDSAEWAGPVIIGGDFNGTEGPRELTRAGFTWLSQSVRNTRWIFDLDHVLVRDLCGTPAGSTGKIDDVRGISDHRPVWAIALLCPR